MKTALLIAPFSDDLSLSRFYNEYANCIKKYDYECLGVQLSKSLPKTISFPTVYLNESGIFPFYEKLCIVLKWVFSKKLRTYAEMQSQSKYVKTVMRQIYILELFKKNLRSFIEEQKVSFVMLNHQFSGFHLQARDICQELNVNFHFWHPGYLPGTMCFDDAGQLAESEFNSLIEDNFHAESEDNIELGTQYLEWVKQTAYTRPGKSRLSDPEELDKVRVVSEKYKRVLLVIGANDYRTGILPGSYIHSDVHSLYYKSSKNLVRDCIKKSNKEDLVLFKPHPNLSEKVSFVESNVMVIRDVLISDLLGFSNIAVTIVSTAAYEALIHGVPCVVAGNLPGSKDGIFYHGVSGIESLKAQIENAFTHQITPDMQKRIVSFFGFSIRNYFFYYGDSAYPDGMKSLDEAISEKFV